MLFLACLCYIAATPKRILITITGFTLAHSLTLVLAALDLVGIPSAPTEAAIALSILFLAREIHFGERRTLTWQYPIAVSSSFGLLHGLAFASALTEDGLPQTHVMAGLFMFNVGVEAGQTIVVLLGLAVVWAGSRLFSLQVMLRGASIANGFVGVAAAY